MIKNRRAFIIPVGNLNDKDAKASVKRLLDSYSREIFINKIDKIEKIINLISL